MNGVHFSSRSMEWETPWDLFNSLDAEFHFTLDPCASIENAKCAKYFTMKDDGLSRSWAGEVVFMNPPYGRDIGKWIAKAFAEKEATVVCLIPSRTDTTYWHNYCLKSDEIRFLRRRIRFNDSAIDAPFPSVIVIFRAGRSNSRPRIGC